MSDVTIVKCSSRVSSDPRAKVSDSENKFSGKVLVLNFWCSFRVCCNASLMDCYVEDITVIPDTPMSDVAIVKCSRASSDPQTMASLGENKFSGRLRH